MLPILIVDDAREDLILTESVLRHCKVTNPVHFMTTGEECIRYFRGGWKSKEGEEAKPCILLLDLAMPIIGGLDVLREIQGAPIADASLKVMISGIKDFNMVRQGYHLGAYTFLIKPLSQEDVAQFLESSKGKIHIEDSLAGKTLHWLNVAAKALSDTKSISKPERASRL